MNKSKNINARYIKKFLSDIKKHDKNFYNIISNKYNCEDSVELVEQIELVINQLSIFGNITRKNLYPLCQCILYGILNNNILVISMNSSALSKNKNTLRDKPQYIQINNIDNQLKIIENIIKVPITYISILPDYSNDFPFEQYDNLWELNRKYLEEISRKKAYRLSQLYQEDLTILKRKIKNKVDILKLESTIKYYENNQFIKLDFAAPANFQRNQILNYMITGYILEEKLPFAILLDVQKRNYPFEQKFYNYARNNKLPIILCGQKY